MLQMPGYGFKAHNINRNTQNLQRLFSDFRLYSGLKGKKTNLYISNPQTICSKQRPHKSYECNQNNNYLN